MTRWDRFGFHRPESCVEWLLRGATTLVALFTAVPVVRADSTATSVTPPARLRPTARVIIDAKPAPESPWGYADLFGMEASDGVAFLEARLQRFGLDPAARPSRAAYAAVLDSADSSLRIRLRNGQLLTPPPPTPRGARGVLLGDLPPDDRRAQHVYIVMGTRPWSYEELLAVLRAGAVILDPLSDWAFVIRASRTSLLTIADLAFVRWLTPYRPEYKYVGRPDRPDSLILTLHAYPRFEPSRVDELRAAGYAPLSVSRDGKRYSIRTVSGAMPVLAERFWWISFISVQPTFVFD